MRYTPVTQSRRERKHKQSAFSRRKSLFRTFELFMLILAWAFILNLLQPFITAVIWWQGYKIIEGNAFSPADIAMIFHIVEKTVYFGIIVFLILLSWYQWDYWRDGRLNRRKAKP